MSGQEAFIYSYIIFLQIADWYTTKKTLDIHGNIGEVNPIVRTMIEKSGGLNWKHLILKVGVAAFFVYCLVAKRYSSVDDPFWVMLIMPTKDGIYGLLVLFMTYVVINNIRALKDAAKRPLWEANASEIHRRYLRATKREFLTALYIFGAGCLVFLYDGSARVLWCAAGNFTAVIMYIVSTAKIKKSLQPEKKEALAIL